MNHPETVQGVSAVISTVLPSLLSNLGKGGQQSSAPAAPSVDYRSIIDSAVGRVRSEFSSRMQQQSAATAQTLNQYRGTINNLQNQNAQLRQQNMQLQVRIAQQANTQNPSPQVIQQAPENTSKLILYGGIGLAAILLLRGF